MIFEIKNGLLGVKRNCFLNIIEHLYFEEKKIRNVWLFKILVIFIDGRNK
jgi:hypothetical protein